MIGKGAWSAIPVKHRPSQDWSQNGDDGSQVEPPAGAQQHSEQYVATVSNQGKVGEQPERPCEQADDDQ